VDQEHQDANEQKGTKFKIGQESGENGPDCPCERSSLKPGAARKIRDEAVEGRAG